VRRKAPTDHGAAGSSGRFGTSIDVVAGAEDDARGALLMKVKTLGENPYLRVVAFLF
jgi:hypothetical protein